MQNKRVKELYLNFEKKYKNSFGKNFYRLYKKEVILKESEWKMLEDEIKQNYKVEIINNKESFKVSLFKKIT